jgi:hypothetical protein
MQQEGWRRGAVNPLNAYLLHRRVQSQQPAQWLSCYAPHGSKGALTAPSALSSPSVAEVICCWATAEARSLT